MEKREVRLEDLDKYDNFVLEMMGYYGAKVNEKRPVTYTLIDTQTREKLCKPPFSKNPSVMASVADSLKKLEKLGILREVPLEKVDQDYHKRAHHAWMNESYFTLTPKGVEFIKGSKKSLTARVVASIFLLAGFFFMAVPDFTTTGNVIGNSAEADISFFLSLGLMIIGGVLLFQSLKKKS